MTVRELIERLLKSDIDLDSNVTIVDQGDRMSLDHVDWDYRDSSERVVELWTKQLSNKVTRRSHREFL